MRLTVDGERAVDDSGVAYARRAGGRWRRVDDPPEHAPWILLSEGLSSFRPPSNLETVELVFSRDYPCLLVNGRRWPGGFKVLVTDAFGARYVEVK